MRPTEQDPKKSNQEKRRTQFKTVVTLLPYLWPRGRLDMKTRVVLAMAALVMAKVASVYIPLLLRDAVDALSTDTAELLAVPVALLFAYGGARILSVIFQELREALFVNVTQRAIRTIALETFQHLHALSLRFHLDRQTGGLSRVIERGVKGIEFVLSFMLFNIIPTLVEILMVCGILWGLFDIRFAAITFFAITSYILFTVLVTEWRLKFRRQMNDKDTEANTKAIDSLLNYETVKYFGNETYEASRYDGAMQGYERAAVRSITSLSLVNIGQGVIISGALVWVMYLAADGVVSGSMTVGDFVLVNAYMIQLYLPLNFLGFVYRQIRQSLTDMEDMFGMLNIPAEVVDKPNAPVLAYTGGRVEFDDVHFSYDPERQILKGLSFTVEPGKTIAIVGPSGAGKSTISRLLFRFYDVSGGAIQIDGQDLRDVSQMSVRAGIGIVPQDTVLFNDTVRYNIRYGNTAASDEAVERAAGLAHIAEFIDSLPDGYKTRVGERGLKLSGGEKQRVAIARTILKDPTIFLFDEATSALDTATEREIQRNLRDVSQGRTTLIIAHRLSTVVDADEIIVLRDGRIAERGRHPDLLEQQGLYAEMWHRQLESREEQATVASVEPDA